MCGAGKQPELLILIDDPLASRGGTKHFLLSYSLNFIGEVYSLLFGKIG